MFNFSYAVFDVFFLMFCSFFSISKLYMKWKDFKPQKDKRSACFVTANVSKKKRINVKWKPQKLHSYVR